MFGESFHCLERGGKDHFFLRTIFAGIETGLKLQQLDLYGLFTLIKPLIPKSAMKVREDMHWYITGLVDRRVDQGSATQRVDIFSYLL